jgi:hypothetical protein
MGVICCSKSALFKMRAVADTPNIAPDNHCVASRDIRIAIASELVR